MHTSSKKLFKVQLMYVFVVVVCFSVTSYCRPDQWLSWPTSESATINWSVEQNRNLLYCPTVGKFCTTGLLVPHVECVAFETLISVSVGSEWVWSDGFNISNCRHTISRLLCLRLHIAVGRLGIVSASIFLISIIFS